MSESRTVTCDTCGRDLTSTGNCNDYRLALVPESIPSGPGAVTDWMNYPAIEKTAHFCGMRCLKTWIAKRDEPKTAVGTVSAEHP